MSGAVLLDSGPLVAYLIKDDRYHEWAVQQFDQVIAPMLTCEAVLAEACFLVQHVSGGVQAIFDLLDTEAIQIGFRINEEHDSIKQLMLRYANVPMSLADACLVRMSEQHSKARILTIDSDFRIYRKYTRQSIPIIAPEG